MIVTLTTFVSGTTITVVALAAVTLLALLAIMAGLRGRRIDEHPLCRRCGFDLFGKPAGSSVCGECGADLSRPRAVRIGHRSRRKVWLITGVVLFLMVVTASTVLGWARVTGIRWITYEPVAWLVRQASSVNADRRGPALEELVARNSAGHIGPSQWPAIVDAATAYESDASKPWDSRWGSLLYEARRARCFPDDQWDRYITALVVQCRSVDSSRRNPALLDLISDLSDGRGTDPQWGRATAAGLDVQGDQTQSWSRSWGDLIELAHDKAKLSDADWKRYAAQCWPGMFGLRVRSNVRRGDPVPYWIDCNRARAANSSKLGCNVQDTRLTFDSLPIPKPNGSHSSIGCGLDGGSATGSSLDPSEFPTGVSNGPQHVHVAGRVRISLRNASFENDSQAIASGRFSLPGTFMLQPADQPTVKIIHDPTLADAIRKSIRIDSVMLQSGSYPYTDINMSMDGPPVGIAFQIILSQDGHELPASTLSCPAGTRNHSYGEGGPVRVHGPKVDIIFRALPAAAAGTTDTFEAWDGEIRFHDVPVQVQKSD